MASFAFGDYFQKPNFVVAVDNGGGVCYNLDTN